MARPSPPPSHLLRSHNAHVNAVYVSDDNERVYSGDQGGTVVITSTRSLRTIAAWSAHTDSILGAQEWGDRIITHARDNKLHVWKRVVGEQPGTSLGGAASLPGSTPELCYSMDVNALNFCRFSLLPLPEDSHGERRALIALPNLVESSLADVWMLSGRQRLHAAIGTGKLRAEGFDGRDAINPVGIIMALHLLQVPHPSMSGRTQLRLLCGYESGGVTMWAYTREDKETSVEGVGWESLWTVRRHVESVMALALSQDGTFALSVSADHLVGRYNLTDAKSNDDAQAATVVFKTTHPGNAAVAIRDDGRVCAIGGWDGKIRLYSTKTFKSLGTLVYHKGNCQSVVFARSNPHAPDATPSDAGIPAHRDEDEDESSEEEKAQRSRWLVSGGHDHRVAIWALMDFGRTKET